MNLLFSTASLATPMDRLPVDEEISLRLNRSSVSYCKIDKTTNVLDGISHGNCAEPLKKSWRGR